MLKKNLEGSMAEKPWSLYKSNKTNLENQQNMHDSQEGWEVSSMAYQMTVTLSDQEYQVLAAEASRRGGPPEKLLRDLIRHVPSDSATKYAMTGRELAEKLYREGKLASLATQQPLTQEEQEERERLARLFASDKPASEMVMEDRGPY